MFDSWAARSTQSALLFSFYTVTRTEISETIDYLKHESQNSSFYDNDNDKPIKTLLKGKGLLPPVGLARLDSYGELLPMSFCDLYFICFDTSLVETNGVLDLYHI
jgi:hypothetical protein